MITYYITQGVMDSKSKMNNKIDALETKSTEVNSIFLLLLSRYSLIVHCQQTYNGEYCIYNIIHII